MENEMHLTRKLSITLARLLLKCHLSEGDLKLALANEMIGVIYFIWGERNKAMKLFRSALNAKRLTLRWRHVEYANTLIHVANVHISQKIVSKPYDYMKSREVSR